MDSPLLAKSKAFALRIIKICNELKSNHRESVLTNQLLQSGTSIGANIPAMSKTRKHKEIQGIPAMAETKNHSKDIESGAPIWYNYAANKS